MKKTRVEQWEIDRAVEGAIAAGIENPDRESVAAILMAKKLFLTKKEKEQMFQEWMQDDLNLERTSATLEEWHLRQILGYTSKASELERQAILEAKEEWGHDTNVLFGDGYAVVSNKKTNMSRTFTFTERGQNEKAQ